MLRSSLISGVLICSIFLLSSLSKVNATDIPIKVYGSGVFNQGDDGRWRCSAQIIMKNISEKNITLMWVFFSTINVTFADETSEELTHLGNYTGIGPLVLKPGDSVALNPNITEAGFDKEPTIIWVMVLSSYLEYELPVISTLPIIPEFPSILMLPLFVITTLLVVLVRNQISRKKRDRWI